MVLDSARSDLTLGIVGAGLMGRGIAQIAAQGGVNVLLFDARDGAALEARKFIQGILERLMAKGKIRADDAAAAVGRIRTLNDLSEVAPCHIIIEAIVENLEVKRQVFRAIERFVTDDCLLATNTSSLSVTAIAAGCRLPGRIGGFHFFSPVPLMKIVEVIDGLLTEGWVVAALTDLARRMGHSPVRAKDTPGFIVNHAGRAFGTEALRILGEGITEFYEVDRILREAGGFRMGPFELMDMTGIDVSHPVIESIYEQYYQEPRYRPSPITRQMLMAGTLGRKTGRGFYKYTNGTAEPTPVMPLPESRSVSVWVSRANPDAHNIVVDLVTRLGGNLDLGEKPRPDSLCIVTPLGGDATTTALAEGLDPQRTMAFDTLFDTSRRRTLMHTPLTRVEVKEAALGLFGSDGVPVSSINDSAGFVAQRVVALIVNIGCDIAQQRIATPQDIDHAVTLGLGYPQGPLAMGDALGARRILSILTNMFEFYGDPRYRPSPWLKRRAMLGVSLLTRE
jgi:3-hydroxybutyryl-CoA dehydrogenase